MPGIRGRWIPKATLLGASSAAFGGPIAYYLTPTANTGFMRLLLLLADILLSTLHASCIPAWRKCVLSLAEGWLRCGCGLAAIWLRFGRS